MAKILVCNESVFHGGVGTYTLSVIEGLQARGWEVSLLVTHGPGHHFQRAREMTKRADDLTSMPLSIGKLRVLTQIINEQSPDILLLNHCSLAHYALPRIVSKIKPVAVLHNDVALFYRVARLFERRIHRWIAPSERLRRRFQAMLPSDLAGRVKMIPHGIDTSRFSPKQKREGPKTVVFIGNLGENKGADLLPEIFRNVAHGANDVRFTVAGEGRLRASLEKRCREEGLSVAFRGHVPWPEVPQLFQEADILVLPTRVEGFGLVIAEAMACGVVPVVSRLSGITDMIVDEAETGCLVACDDISGFSRSVLDLLGRPNELQRMSANARNAVQARFSRDRMLEDYEGIFREEDNRDSASAGPLGWMFEIALEIGCRRKKSREISARLEEMA